LEACRVVYFGEGNAGLLTNPENDETFYEKRGYLADSTFFKLFIKATLPFVPLLSSTSIDSATTRILFIPELFNAMEFCCKTIKYMDVFVRRK
jgi:hypothetical protein